MAEQHEYSKISSELYARFMLQALFPARYGVLERSDKPDLKTQDGAVGIEVTRVVWPGEMILAKYLHPAQNEEDPDNADPEVIGISSPYNGVNYEGFGKLLDYKYGRINNDGYAPCGEYDLYVIWRDLFEDEIPGAVEMIAEENRANPVNYRYVYLDTIGLVVRFDSLSGETEKISSGEESAAAFAKVTEMLAIGADAMHNDI